MINKESKDDVSDAPFSRISPLQSLYVHWPHPAVSSDQLKLSRFQMRTMTVHGVKGMADMDQVIYKMVVVRETRKK